MVAATTGSDLQGGVLVNMISVIMAELFIAPFVLQLATMPKTGVCHCGGLDTVWVNAVCMWEASRPPTPDPSLRGIWRVFTRRSSSEG